MNLNRRQLLVGGSALALAPMIPAMSFAQEGKILVIATASDMVHFDPHFGADNQTTFLIRNVYDTLVSVQNNPPEIIPRLATTWTASPDGLTYTFKLDPSAKFHDGAPLTSADVKYSFERLARLSRGNAWMIAGIVGPEGIATPDATTVVFTLSKPFAAFLQVLPWLAVVNSKLVDAYKGADDGQAYLRTTTAGSGPFQLARFEPSSAFIFARVTDGWRKGGGNLDGVIWKLTREASTQRLLVERGEVHVAMDLSLTDIQSLKGKPGVKLVIERDYTTYLMRMNTRHGPLADVNMRKAISYAFNYKAMKDIGGFNDMLTGPLPSSMFGFDPSLVAYSQNLDKAKEYLAKSSMPNGGFTLKFTCSDGLDYQRQCGLILLDALQPLNIKVDVQLTHWADLVEMVKSPDSAPDIASINQGSSYADPDNVAYPTYHSSQNGQWQNPVYSNPKADALILAGRSETDPAKRKAIYGEFQKLIVDEAPDIFGYNFSQMFAVRDTVANYVFCPVGSTSMDCFPISLT
jgi:peptide/nickel transport system substrate-binding protein